MSFIWLNVAHIPPPPMPQGTVPPFRRVLPQTPAPAATDNPPFPGTARQLFNIIRSNWDLPYIGAQSKQSQRSFYNPGWDVILPPPQLGPNSSLLLNRILALQAWLASDQATNFPKPRLLKSTPALFPPTDNPPLWLLPERMALLAQLYEQYRKSQLEYTAPKLSNISWRFPFIPPILPVSATGLIAFQPNAFQIGYPRRAIAFQGFNRFLQTRTLGVRPFLRIALNTQRRGRMEDKRRGDAVTITATIFDPSSQPEVLFTPEGVALTIYDPLQNVVVNAIDMTAVSQGQLLYVYQIPMGAPLGVYTGEVSARNFGRTARSLRQGLFKVISII
jgi:hypothetical protein